jgi:hypothetical protein
MGRHKQKDDDEEGEDGDDVNIPGNNLDCSQNGEGD